MNNIKNYINYKHKKVEKKAIKFINNIKSNNKKYIVSMFPYPSGIMHLGHVRNYIINDVICRNKNIKMFMGWDAFGLPAENFSIKNLDFPIRCINKNVKNMKKQMLRLGLNIEWKKEFKTCDSKFYYWTQYIFQQMLKKGFIYKKKNFVNWDTVDKTALSNEQIINKKGWRSGGKIKKKLISAYFLKISTIIKELIKEINKSKWPNYIKNMQIKWIGEKEGNLLRNKKISIFFKKKQKKFKNLGISIENKITRTIYKKNYIFKKKYKKFETNKKKINMFFGFYKTKLRKIPLFVSNKIKYKKYFHKIKIKLNKKKKKQQIKYYFNKNKKIIKKKIYKILDWNISRQRYWGTPIPVTKCKNCGIKNSKIPVKIPLNIIPDGKNQLKKNKKFLKTKCLLCKKKSKRETDTLDTFFDSSWYYIFYIINNIKKYNNKSKPIDIYIGGVEHSILHLLYARIFTLILKKIKFINFKEPFKKLIIQGLILNKTYYYYESKKKIWISKKDIKKHKKKKIITEIKKMSKSKNNGINPEIYKKKYGSDSLRLYILFLAPIKKNIIWDDKKIIGCYRFIKRTWRIGFEIFNKNIKTTNINNKNIKNKKIKEIEKEINNNYRKIKFNIIISLLMKEIKIIKKNFFYIKKKKLIFEKLLRNIYPICPFFSYILWQILGIKKRKGEIYEYSKKNKKKNNKKKIISFIIQINNINKNKIKIKKNLNFYKILKIINVRTKLFKKIYFLKNRFINFIKKSNICIKT